MRGGWLGEGWQGEGALEREGKSTIKITEVSIMSKNFPVPEVAAEVLGFDLSAKGAGETWWKKRKRSGFHTGFLPVPPSPP